MSDSSDESIPGTPPHRAPPRRGRYSNDLASYVKKNVNTAIAGAAQGSVASATGFSAAEGGGSGEAGVSSRDVERVKPRMLLAPGEDGRATVSDWIANPHMPKRRIVRLEWSWDMGLRHLNLNHKRNMHTLTPTLHRWFYRQDRDGKPTGWFWLPLDATPLFEMQDTFVGNEEARASYTPWMRTNARRNPNSFYNTTKFQYRLVPLPTMNSPAFSITHGTTTYAYPFTDLPPVTSRIPPHVVVVDTGRKLRQLYDSDTGAIAFEEDFAWMSDSVTRDMMTAVQRIYMAWICAWPERRWLEGGDEEDEDDDEYSD
ncbi:hypothetical protein NLJ89_g9613 [Agrocybe chaxingu]|uniref:Uncharacterized protein n=1 Tax=Agrocybe chaxingu TaxID=84603 RepID=A0A9W8MR20_9AGAR|nr:hypothetical protein NLJ89_g9613 [Agrocybe chaxingu]